MNPEEKSDLSHCFECSTELRKKRLKQCTDCSEFFCKKHIKQNDNDFSTLCPACLKKRVHLELSMEMETEILQFKSEHRDIKSKLKLSTRNLESLEETFSTLSHKLESKESHHKKSLKLMREELEHVGSSVNWEVYEDTLQSLSVFQTSVKTLKERFRESSERTEEGSVELSGLQLEIEKYNKEIVALSDKTTLHVPYTIIRALCCESCKDLIKKRFAEEIKKGYLGRNSIMASMYTDSSKSAHSSSLKKPSKSQQDSCNCLVY